MEALKKNDKLLLPTLQYRYNHQFSKHFRDLQVFEVRSHVYDSEPVRTLNASEIDKAQVAP